MYTPNPAHTLYSALMIVIGSVVLVYARTSALTALGLGFWVIGGVTMLWMFIAGMWKAREEYNYSLAKIAQAIKDMEPHQWTALGIRYPELRIRFTGEPMYYLEDTDIRMDLFKQFIEDSDEYQIAPERLYGDGTLARKQWNLWRAWLEQKHMIIKGSAAGSHSWLWRTGRRQQLISMYLGGTTPQDLNEMESA